MEGLLLRKLAERLRVLASAEQEPLSESHAGQYESTAELIELFTN